MQRDLPARLSLLGRPQRLGILPTYWFWNDGERQRLLVPIVALIALPVTPLLFLLMVRFQLSMWLLLAAGTLWPQLVMGLVERHIRRELRRRPLEDGRILDGLPAAPRPSSASPRVFLALAALCGLAALLAALNVGGPVMLATMSVAAIAALLPRAVSLASKRLASSRGGPLSLAPDAEDCRR